MDSGEVDRLIVELAKTTARLGEAAATISAAKPSEGNAVAEAKAPKGIVTDKQEQSLDVDKLLQGFEKILGDQFKKDSKSDDDRKKKADKKKENQNDSPRRIQQKAQPITLVGFDRTALSQLGKVFGSALNSLKSKASKSKSGSSDKGGLGKLGLAGLLGAGALAAFTAGDEYWGISKLLARLSLEGGKWLKSLTSSFSKAGMGAIKAGSDFMKSLGDDIIKRIKGFFGLGKGAKGGGFFAKITKSFQNNKWLKSLRTSISTSTAKMIKSGVDFMKNLGDDMLKRIKGFFGIGKAAKGGGVFAKIGKSVGNIFKGIKAAIGKLLGFAGNAGSGGGKGATKALAKSSLKWIPGFGLLIGLAFAYFEWKSQGWAKGWPYILGNIASGLASMFPGIGTGISIGIDVLMLLLKSQEKKQEEKTGKQVSGGGWFKLIGKTLWKLINPVLKFIPGIGTAVYLFEAWQAKDDVKKMVKKLALGLLALAPIPGLAVGTELLLHFLDKKKGEDPKTEKVPFSLKAFGKTIFDLVMNNFPVKNIMRFGKGVGQVVTGKFKEGFKNMAFAVPFLEAIYNWVSGPEPAAEGAQAIPEKKSWLGKALDWIGSAVKAILKGIAWPFKKVLEWLGWDMGNEKVSDSSIIDPGSPAPKPKKVSLWSKIGKWIGGFIKGTFLVLTWPIRWVAKALGFFPDEKEISNDDFVDSAGGSAQKAPKVPLWKKILNFGLGIVKGIFTFMTFPIRMILKAVGFFVDAVQPHYNDFVDNSGATEQKAPKVSIWKKLLNFGVGLLKGAAKFLAWPIKKALQWMGFFKENEVEDETGELGKEVDKQGWITSLAGAIGGAVTATGKFIGDGIKGAIDFGKSALDAIGPGIVNMAEAVTDVFSSAEQKALKKARDIEKGRETRAATVSDMAAAGEDSSVSLALSAIGVNTKKDVRQQLRSRVTDLQDKNFESFIDRYTTDGYLMTDQFEMIYVGKGKPPKLENKQAIEHLKNYDELSTYLHSRDKLKGGGEGAGKLIKPEIENGFVTKKRWGRSLVNDMGVKGEGTLTDRLTDIGKVGVADEKMMNLLEIVSPQAYEKMMRKKHEGQRSEGGVLKDLLSTFDKLSTDEGLATYNLQRKEQAEKDKKEFKALTREDVQKMLGEFTPEVPDPSPVMTPDSTLPPTSLTLTPVMTPDSVPAQTPEATTAQVVDKNNEAMQVAIKQMGSDIVEALEAAAKQYNESKGATIATRNNTTINNVTPAQAVPAGAVTMPASQQSQ